MVSKFSNKLRLKGFIQVTLPTKISKIFHYFALFVGILVIIMKYLILLFLLKEIKL
jgi:hypothetical protein